MHRWLLMAVLALAGCIGKPVDSGDSAAPEVDVDGDGYGAAEDCDDEDAAVYPGAPEVCNGLDDDCDGYVDDEDPNLADGTVAYRDEDSDGWGRDDDTVLSCLIPSGYVAKGGDCHDGQATIHPGADEHCDGVDEDCDGAIDEDPVDGGTWYLDVDADGYGDPEHAVAACSQPAGVSSEPSDCDDGDARVYPGAQERCDGVDDDCDGEVDEADAVDAPTWCADADGDGYGEADSCLVACDVPTGHVAEPKDGLSFDCDDGNATIHPGADEHCDGVDEDCDGHVDEDPVDGTTWYADVDGDGFGVSASASVACSQPSGTAADSSDCDDADASVHPGADEHCDGVDEDCDGTVDEADAVDAPTWYADADGDGYGDASVDSAACSQPTGSVAGADDGVAFDCDDGDATIHPGADEYCDGVDEDCDGSVDEGAVDGTTWYADGDGDGYGDSASTSVACSAPSGHVADATDCDDGDASVYPGATELCDELDNDCDGAVDGAGLATWVDSGGAVSDLSSTLGAGSATAAVTFGITGDGSLSLCEGTWYLHLVVQAADVVVRGPSGSGSTMMQGDSSAAIVQAGSGAAIIALEGLTISGGFSGAGGGLSAGNEVLDVTVDDLVIEDCWSYGDGGGIYMVGGSLTATGLVLDGNLAGSSGGGLYLYGGDLSASELTVTNNEADYISGGLYLTLGSFEIDGATISGNSASYGGGGTVYGGTLDLADSEVASNVAEFWGGGWYLHTATLTMNDSQVHSNQAAPGTYDGVGGGLLAYSGSTISCAGSISVTAGVYANHAYYGGGVYLYDYGCALVSDVCDWGTSGGGDDNWYADTGGTSMWSYAWGNDASFTCAGSSCW